MKISLFVAATILSISAYSQAFMQPRNIRDGVDLNNAALKKPSIISNALFANRVDMTEYTYDTVRELTEINRPDLADVHPWISSDGLRLYYTSDFYDDQLVMAERSDVNSFFGPPTVLPIPFNWGISYWLSTDELDLYFADGWGWGLYYCHRDATNQPFSSPFKMTLTGFSEQDYLSAQSLNSTQYELFIHGSPPDKIMEFEGYWPYYQYVRTLHAPPGFSLLGGQLSKDDLTYFTGAEDVNGKYMLYQMTRPTPSDTFAISTFQLIEGINDTSIGNVFPTMSDSLEWVAFNKITNESWEGIDLYLAHNGILTSVFDPIEPQIFTYVFPNPSKEYIYLKYRSTSEGSILVSFYSFEGVLVYENVLKPYEGIIQINTSSWNNGFYCYRLTQQSNQKTKDVTGKFVVMH